MHLAQKCDDVNEHENAHGDPERPRIERRRRVLLAAARAHAARGNFVFVPAESAQWAVRFSVEHSCATKGGRGVGRGDRHAPAFRSRCEMTIPYQMFRESSDRATAAGDALVRDGATQQSADPRPGWSDATIGQSSHTIEPHATAQPNRRMRPEDRRPARGRSTRERIPTFARRALPGSCA